MARNRFPKGVTSVKNALAQMSRKNQQDENRGNVTGEKSSEIEFSTTPFVQLPHAILSHGQEAKLDYKEVSVLVRLIYRYDGNNNGRLVASVTALQSETKMRRSYVIATLKSLEEKGFIVTEKEYPNNPKYRLADEYRLTWLSDSEGREPTYDFLKKPTSGDNAKDV